jgi:hypothetical protein
MRFFGCGHRAYRTADVPEMKPFRATRNDFERQMNLMNSRAKRAVVKFHDPRAQRGYPTQFQALRVVRG